MFDFDDCEKHIEVCSRRFGKGLMGTMQGGMWRLSPDDFVKVLCGRLEKACRSWLRTISKSFFERCVVSCGVLLRTIPQKFDFDGSGWHVKVCA